MSIPTSTGINTALSGLEAMMAGIDTTSQNISNASNPDYAEEMVNFGESANYIENTGGLGAGQVDVGTGVTVQSISRQDNPFLDQQYYTANANASNSSTIYNQLDNAQADLDVTSSSGLTSAISSFFSSWNSLSTDPTSSTAQDVASTGQTLADQLNSLSGEVETLQSQASGQLTALTDPTTGEVQTYATQIAQLNTQISQATEAGQSPNALEDERASAIDSLSSLVSVTVTPVSGGTNPGADTITLGDGTTLVDGTDRNASTAVTLPTSYSSADGGEIGALASLASSSGPLGSLQSGISSLATTIADNVNGLLPTGSSFFTVSTDATTGVTTMSLSQSESATTSSVLSMAQSTSVTPSDTSDPAASGTAIAESISGLSDTVTDAYSGFVTEVGDTVNEAQDTDSTNQSLLTSVSNQRSSVSGVSLDQEMTNLISFQQGYQAAAKVMDTMTTVLQSLIDAV